MAKKKQLRTQIRLDPDNEEKLKELSRTNPLKPSVAKLANLLIRKNASSLQPK